MKDITPSHLANGICQDLDDLLVRCGDHTLPVDFNDAVSDTDAPPLRYTPSHQAADLCKDRK